VVERAQRLEAEAADLRSQLKQKAEDNERLTQLLSAEQQKSSAGASGVASSGATGTHTHTPHARFRFLSFSRRMKESSSPRCSLAHTAELEEELESTQKKLKKAKKEIEEKEKRIDELQLLVVKASSSTSGASAGESVEALKKQVDKQKTDIKALNKENRDSKDKIETLQQELDRAKSGGGGGGGAGSDAKELENLRKKLKSFEKEKEEDELIEREIYCMTTKYRVCPSSSRSSSSSSSSSGSFSPAVNTRRAGGRACFGAEHVHDLDAVGRAGRPAERAAAVQDPQRHQEGLQGGHGRQRGVGQVALLRHQPPRTARERGTPP
jgi:hypothetical protein